MARPQTLTNQDILRRARPVFLSRGLDARTRDIASAVGLTWGAIARRFGCKQAMFEQAMGHRAGCCAQDRLDGGDDADLGVLLQQLKSILALQWPMHLRLHLASAGSNECIACLSELHRWLTSGLCRLAERGKVRRDVPPKKLAELILLALSGDAAERFLRRRQDAFSCDSLVQTIELLLSAKTHALGTGENVEAVHRATVAQGSAQTKARNMPGRCMAD